MTEASSAGAVLVRDEGAVRAITLNRPQRLNAIDMAMLDGLDAALAGAEAASGVRAILLAGAGRAFTVGDDLDAQQEISAAGLGAVERQVEVLQRISEHMLFGAKPVVGAVQGWAVGGGFAWTLNCDFALWAEDACGFLPEIAYGLFVSGGSSWLLPRLAGPAMAREMILRGRRMSAPELRAAGISSRVVPAARLQAEAMTLAQELAALPPEAVARAKRALVDPDKAALRLAMQQEAEACIAGASDPATLARLKDVAAKRKSS
uniref:Putative crotonase n=1 Tax=uncultured bacterium 1116 TaxID=548899 RepID=B8R900_9BACT|nr:putative crotonase [uncultured bacterium 1116]